MIDRREILEAASSFSLLPTIVEKDYVLRADVVDEADEHFNHRRKPGVLARTLR